MGTLVGAYFVRELGLKGVVDGDGDVLFLNGVRCVSGREDRGALCQEDEILMEWKINNVNMGGESRGEMSTTCAGS